MSRNYDSITNQRIKEELVRREVMCCATDIVEYILKASSEVEDAPFTYDDIENTYKKVCPECGEELEEITEDEIVPIHKFQCVDCGENYDTYEEAQKCCYVEEDEDTTLEECEVKEVWICPFCEDEYDTEEEAKGCICHYREDIFKCYNGHYVKESDASEEPNEVYEWWEVTNWFADKLAEHGETVIRGWHCYWGRCCTGQSVSMDWIIGKIAEEMEILESQENSWEDR